MNTPGGTGEQQTQQTIKAWSEEAIGPGSYPTRRIGLKEALFLLHARRISASISDDINQSGRPDHVLNHMVVAAMLMDLLQQRRVEIGRSLFGRNTIHVIDASAVGDADTDAFLAYLQTSRPALQAVYTSYARNHLVARLIDQLRKGEYLRLHTPATGPLGPRALWGVDVEMPDNPRLQDFTTGLSKQGLCAGTIVAAEDYSGMLPWAFLYTTHTRDEESMFSRVQAAIAARSSSDDFIRTLLLLISALYVSRTLIQGYIDVNSIYRFYPKNELKGIVTFLRDYVKQAPEGLQAVYRVAKNTDEARKAPSSSV